MAENMDLDISHSDGDTIDHISPESINKSGKAKRSKNTDWNILGPKNKESLYYKICHSKDVKYAITGWCDSYEISKETSILQVLQLFIDMSSYQNFNVSEFLDRNDIDDIVNQLEMSADQNDDLNGKYFCKMRTKLFRRYHKLIEDFILKLIIVCDTNTILYDNCMLPYPVKLITLMSGSRFRAVRHTGVFIGLKFISGLVHIVRTIYDLCFDLKNKILEAKEKHEDSASMEIQNNELQHNYKFINRFLHILHEYVFKKNWNLRDNNLFTMRESCILETKRWIRKLPDKYLKNDVLPIVMQAITDDNKTVRLAALTIFMSVFDTDRYKHHEQLKLNFKKYIVTIVGRIMDKDLNVAVYAIDLLSVIDKQHRRLSQVMGDRILLKMYCKYYQLAVASGRFLIQKLQVCSADDYELLENLIKYQEEVEKDNNILGRRALLVEAVYDCLPMLQDMSIYAHLLEQRDLNAMEKEILSDIVCEILIILDTGTSSLKRCPKKKIDTKKTTIVLQDLLNVIKIFAKNFHTDRFKIVANLIKKYVEHLRPVQTLITDTSIPQDENNSK